MLTLSTTDMLLVAALVVGSGGTPAVQPVEPSSVSQHANGVLHIPLGATASFTWRNAPNAAELTRAYPAGERGRLSVAMDCALSTDGHPERCRIRAQYPTTSNVGKVALSLVGKYQAPLDVVSKARALNGYVMLQIDFTPAEDPNAEWIGDRCPMPFCMPEPGPAPSIGGKN